MSRCSLISLRSAQACTTFRNRLWYYLLSVVPLNCDVPNIIQSSDGKISTFECGSVLLALAQIHCLLLFNAMSPIEFLGPSGTGHDLVSVQILTLGAILAMQQKK